MNTTIDTVLKMATNFNADTKSFSDIHKIKYLCLQAKYCNSMAQSLDLQYWSFNIEFQKFQKKDKEMIEFLRNQAYILYLQSQSLLTLDPSSILQSNTLKLQARSFDIKASTIEFESQKDKEKNNLISISYDTRARDFEKESKSFTQQALLIEIKLRKK